MLFYLSPLVAVGSIMTARSQEMNLMHLALSFPFKGLDTKKSASPLCNPLELLFRFFLSFFLLDHHPRPKPQDTIMSHVGGAPGKRRISPPAEQRASKKPATEQTYTEYHLSGSCMVTLIEVFGHYSKHKYQSPAASNLHYPLVINDQNFYTGTMDTALLYLQGINHISHIDLITVHKIYQHIYNSFHGEPT